MNKKNKKVKNNKSEIKSSTMMGVKNKERKNVIKGKLKDFKSGVKEDKDALKIVKSGLRVIKGRHRATDSKFRAVKYGLRVATDKLRVVRGKLRIIKSELRTVKGWLRMIGERAVNYLPQIYRFFTAKKDIRVWGWFSLSVCTIYIIFNLMPLPRLYSLFKNFDYNWQDHVSLGDFFLSKNNLESAKKEFLIASILLPNSQEIENRIKDTDNLTREKTNLENEVSFWEKEIEKKSGYRDAYLKLALLNYQLKRPALARFYWQRAKELDPNGMIVKEVEEVVR